MSELLAKLKSWIPKNIAGILGIVQAIVKFGKEVATSFLNLICPIIPGDKDLIITQKVRDIFNLIDEWIEKIKTYLLKL